MNVEIYICIYTISDYQDFKSFANQHEKLHLFLFCGLLVVLASDQDYFR